MGRNKNKKKRWIEADRNRVGEPRVHHKEEQREEPEYYDEYDEEDPLDEAYYDGYEDETEYYDEYGEDAVSGEESEYYEEYGEDAVSEEEPEYYDEYGEDAVSGEEPEYYEEYGEDAVSGEEPEYYEEYGEGAVSEEEPEYYEEYGEDAVSEEEPEYYGGDGIEAPLEEEPAEFVPEDGFLPSPKKKKKNRVLLPVLGGLFLLGLAGGFFYGEMPHYLVKEELTIEAGASCPAAAEFLKRGDGKDVTVSGIDENAVFNHVEDIPVTVHVHLWDVPAVLHVVDTVEPELEVKNVTILLGESFGANDFVESVSDMTSCEVSWEEPEITAGGTYTVVLTAVDEGGNRAQKEAVLEVLEDTTAPVIEGVKELTAGVGKTVSYKRDITVTDDCDEDVKLEIDNSQVDLDTPGDYEVIYSATDKAGNKTEISTILHVIEEPTVEKGGEEVVITEEMVNAQADKILSEITDPSMSQYEVIQAIYNWCNKKIAYLDGVPKTNWVVGAYEGLIERRGDCYTFAMSSKCLLNRAGIKNMDIERVRVGDSMHFWNLVDIGEGWHHFDTCRRGDGATFFYLTDAELMAYSNAHISAKYPNGTHYYDRSLYPEIP